MLAVLLPHGTVHSVGEGTVSALVCLEVSPAPHAAPDTKWGWAPEVRQDRIRNEAKYCAGSSLETTGRFKILEGGEKHTGLTSYSMVKN